MCFGGSYAVYLVVRHFFLSQGVQERANLTSPLLSKEDPIFSSLSHKLGRSVDEVGHRIHQGLLRVRSTQYTVKIFKTTVPLCVDTEQKHGMCVE